ncbi:unnamed protein product [Cylicostephanus goldi]|uniref:Uncharacterized protein n=1 Tax=Cylicostephanus goldi TaxID=71465 RepID=A0A3P6RPT7_CYLGO|nr:unnamed protein product [Cylicostephanus goldi]
MLSSAQRYYGIDAFRNVDLTPLPVPAAPAGVEELSARLRTVVIDSLVDARYQFVLVPRGVMIFGLVKYQPLRIAAYNYDYPFWGHVFGWFLSLSSMLCIPGYAIYAWVTTDGTLSEKFKILCRPDIEIEKANQQDGHDDTELHDFHQLL